MNKHEIHGGARYVGGKLEKGIGDVVDSTDWKVDGVVDQVAGAGENMFGRAQSVAEDAVDAAPHVIEKGLERSREVLGDAADRTVAAAKSGRQAVERSIDERPTVWAAASAAIAAAAAGYAIAWLIHGQRD